MKKTAKPRLVVIDGNSLINRAYYAIQRPMLTKDGLYTQAVYGFLVILEKIIKEHHPDGLFVAFDRKAPTFRHEEYADYKATRKGMPPELAMQMPVLHELLDAFRIPIVEIDGFEADDIIGTAVKRAEAEGYAPLVITGDRDALQLASDSTQILITRRGISEFDLYDAAAIKEKYGLTPEQIVDLKGLMGDASDNIPGIPGVGEKTALKLLKDFAGVDDLLTRIDELPNEKLREKIRDNEQLARLSRRLAEIHTNVPVEIDFARCKIEEPDYEKLVELYKRLEFNSFLRKLKRPSSADPDSPTEAGDGFQQYEPETVSPEEFAKRLPVGGLLAIKVFSNNDHRAIPEIHAVCLASNEPPLYTCLNGDSARDLVTRLLTTKEPRLCGHFIQTDIYALHSAWLADWMPTPVFDSAVAQYLIQPGRSNYALTALAQEYLNRNLETAADNETADGQLTMLTEPATDYVQRGLDWCRAVFELQPLIRQELDEQELLKLFEEVELPLIPVLAQMEAVGFKVDRAALEEAGIELGRQIEQLQQEIYKQAGQEFNIQSPRQLGEILFEKLGLPTGKKTKTGYSTNMETLDKLREEHPIIELILQFRTVSKLKSTYVDGLLPLIHEDGRIHAHFQQTVAATGRISCTEPNLQNIPIRQEQGRLLRKAFICSDPVGQLIGADYSQIEMRLLADQADDPVLIESFNQGADIHSLTAARVFNVAENEVTPLMRSSAKAVNFGIIYGMSSFGLSSGLNISRRKAEEYISAYFAAHPKVKQYLENQVEQTRQTGFTVTLMGRRRPIPEILASNYMLRQAGERLAMNSPLQGGAADIVKIAMILCQRELKERQMKTKLILQVHDELILDAPAEETEMAAELLKRNMEEAVALKVDLVAEVNRGSNWYELK
ncbi:MAG TPA: DNA polymerase I [Clostridiales bacterium]|nr:DNA polymerase I [Clostridiales bacterium]